MQDMAIFIGFAFRDPYINDILSGLSQDIPKFVINKGDSPPDFLALEDQEHSENGLTADSVDACLRILRQQKAQLSLKHANTKITSRDYKAAITDYDRATKIDPDNAAVYHKRGLAKAALGEHRAAIADYDRAIEIDPDNATVYHNRGIAKRVIGDQEGATKDSSKANAIKKKLKEA